MSLEIGYEKRPEHSFCTSMFFLNHW